MSSTISRFISCAYSTLFLNPNEEYVFFKPVSIKPFLKNKKHAWNLYGKSCRNLQHLSTFVRQSKVNPPPEDPLPSGSPSGSLRNWIVGIVLTFIIPIFSRKWGSLLLLKNKFDQKIETTERIVESVEKVAERADEVIDSITDDLPKHSKLKNTLERVDEIAEGVAKSAHIADDIINKVEKAEDKMESLIHHEKSKRLEIPREYKEDQEITNKEESSKNIK